MRKLLLILFLLIFFIFVKKTFAIENPLQKPNNKFGIHILFVNELNEAAKLVNSNGGQWGYVTIPIQSGDKDLLKWQKFMDGAKKLHIIPIIRLASEGDYFNTKVWRKPTANDVLDFANFLNSLDWPIKNRYVIIFNEVNRGDEWGGTPNASEYADLLSYAATVFKSKSSNFFVISAGLDNAAANTRSSINQFDFMRQMYSFNSTVFDNIDGIASHSYPNPGFSQPPSGLTSQSISSFKFEKELIKNLSGKNLPVFITETGWSKELIPENTISAYFKTAFDSVWNDQDVAAVTPFLLSANAGPFIPFSFLNQDGSPTQIYKTVESIPKTKGEPEIEKKADKKEDKILGHKTEINPKTEQKDFSNNHPLNLISNISPSIKLFLKWILKM